MVFDDELLIEGSKKWMLTLCRHFFVCKMSYYELRYNLIRMWSKFGPKDIVSQKWSIFVQVEEGMNHVLGSGPWFVNNKPL